MSFFGIKSGFDVSLKIRGIHKSSRNFRKTEKIILRNQLVAYIYATN